MKEYNYNFDSENFEIFPENIWKDPLIVFHGTTTNHSESIEKDGFKIHTTPYKIADVKKLVETLEMKGFSEFDEKKGFFNWTTSFGIRHYIDAIEKKEFRLSFSNLSYACIQYAMGETKGGQAFRDVRLSKEIIDKAINNDKTLTTKIPKEVKHLFEQIEILDKSKSVVYAVKLPTDLDGVEWDTNNVIHSRIAIPVNSIIGKVIIPSDFINSIPQQLINDKIKSKLTSSKGLGVMIRKKEFGIK